MFKKNGREVTHYKPGDPLFNVYASFIEKYRTVYDRVVEMKNQQIDSDELLNTIKNGNDPALPCLPPFMLEQIGARVYETWDQSSPGFECSDDFFNTLIFKYQDEPRIFDRLNSRDPVLYEYCLYPGSVRLPIVSRFNVLFSVRFVYDGQKITVICYGVIARLGYKPKVRSGEIHVDLVDDFVDIYAKIPGFSPSVVEAQGFDKKQKNFKNRRNFLRKKLALTGDTVWAERLNKLEYGWDWFLFSFINQVVGRVLWEAGQAGVTRIRVENSGELGRARFCFDNLSVFNQFAACLKNRGADMGLTVMVEYEITFED